MQGDKKYEEEEEDELELDLDLLQGELDLHDYQKQK